MKSITSLLLLSLFVLGCSKNEDKEKNACEHPACSSYFQQWEELLKERNQLSDYYYDAHVFPTNYQITENRNGELFKISYTVQIDWAEIQLEDQFMINIKDAENVYPYSNVRRNVYFTKKEVDAMLSYRSFDAKMNELSAVEKLDFASANEAIRELRKIAKTSELYFDHLGYKHSTIGFKANGHPYMFSRGNVNPLAKTRLMGEINLVNRTSSTYLVPLENKIKELNSNRTFNGNNTPDPDNPLKGN